MSLSMNGKLIVQCNEVKYLGLHVDPHLNFDSHVAKVCTKVNVRTKLLWRVRSFINLELAFTLYRALIEPHLLYCNFILEGTTKSNKQKLQVQQNNALRAVKCVRKCCSATELRKSLGVDDVATQMMKACCKFVYRGFYQLGPSSLNNMFELQTNVRDLRSNDQLQCVVLRCRTQFGERNFRYRGSIHWNTLPVDLKSATSSDNLKSKLKHLS